MSFSLANRTDSEELKRCQENILELTRQLQTNEVRFEFYENPLIQ